MSTATLTKKAAVLETLKNHEGGVTAAQLETWLNIGNVRATVSDLRFDGYAIYANRKTDTKGRTKTFYRLGRPSRAIVAAGYRAMAQGI
jgi:predicted ArsR family transcriptional regulator